MEPTLNQTQTTGAAAKLQAVVDYLPGITIAGAKPALLEWSADDRIKLFEMDFDTNTAKSVLFDASLGEIEQVTGSMIMLTFQVAGKKYNAQFSQSAMPALALGGGVGLGLAHNRTKASGINLWVEKLKESGVTTNVLGWNWSIKWGLIGGAILIGVAVIITMIIAAVAVFSATS